MDAATKLACGLGGGEPIDAVEPARQPGLSATARRIGLELFGIGHRAHAALAEDAESGK
jgi:hypothetical protein